MVVSGIVLSSTDAEGQSSNRFRDRSYRPARPTVSPYLNLMRDDVGALPNYQTFVRPIVEQQRINREADRRINDADRQITELRQAPMPGTAPQQPVVTGRALQVRRLNVRRTGINGQFQYYSHFFPIRSATRSLSP